MSTHTRLTALYPGLPGWAGTRKVKPIWILLKQETVSGSDISWAVCKSASCSRQITMPAPHRLVFYRPDALLATQPTASKHWRQLFNQLWDEMGQKWMPFPLRLVSFVEFFPSTCMKWLVSCCRQSCVASEYLDRLLLTALHDPSLSQQAAVLHQHQRLKHDLVTTNAACGTAMKSVCAKLRNGSTVCIPVSCVYLMMQYHMIQNILKCSQWRTE